MNIRYRDRYGRWTTPAKASRQKLVKSELYEGNKKVGKTVQGYYTQTKKLAREAMPPVKLKPQKEYKSKPAKGYTTTVTHKGYRTTESTIDFTDEYDSDFGSDEDYEELEELWHDEYEEEFGDLDDYLDDLEDILESDDEWYED